MTAGRVPYAVACQAARDALTRAQNMNPELRPRQWRILVSILTEVTLYSRLTDRLLPAHHAAAAGLDDRRTLAKELRLLADLGLIIYEPGKGRPKQDRSNWPLVGFPPKGVAPDPLMPSTKGVAADPLCVARKGGRSGAKRGSERRKKGVDANAVTSTFVDDREDPYREDPYPRRNGVAQSASEDANDDTTRSTKKRDDHNVKDEDQDPLAARLADAVGAPYADAVKTVHQLLADGIGDLVIDEVIGYAAEHDVHSLRYVETVAANWMTQRDPGRPRGRIA